jgi:hypothetical protein
MTLSRKDLTYYFLSKSISSFKRLFKEYYVGEVKELFGCIDFAEGSGVDFI